MAVPRNLTHLAFAAPLDESTEDEVLDPMVGFPVLQNVRQDRRGGVSKRLGYGTITSARTSGSARTDGQRCFAHNGTPCVISSSGVDVYSEGLTANVPAAGTPPRCTVDTIPLIASVPSDLTLTYDAVVCNGFLVLAYGHRGTRVDATVQRVDDAAVVLRAERFATAYSAHQVHLASVGNIVFCGIAAISGGGLGIIDLYKIDCTSTTTIASGWSLVMSVNDRSTASSLAFSMCAQASTVAFAYANNSAGTSRLTVKTANAAGAVASITVNTSSTTPNQVGIGTDGTTSLWVCWDETLNVRLAAFTPATLGAITATITIATSGLMTTRPPVVLPTSTTTAIVYVLPAPVGRLIRAAVHHSGGVLTLDSAPDCIGANLASQPFVRGSAIYSLVTASDNDIETAYSVALADITYSSSAPRFAVTPHAFLSPNLIATDYSTKPFTLPDGRPAYVATKLSAASVRSFQVVAFDFADRFNWRSVGHNGSTFLSGGLLSYLSTDRVQEASILQTPQNLAATNTGAGTGPTGNVSYVAVFTSVDGSGNLTISGASEPLTHVATGFSITIECDPLMITSRDYRTLSVAFYRTVAGGKVYYRVATLEAQSQTSFNLSTTDSMSDATLVNMPLLYGTGALPGTGGAPLQREAPPYCADVVSFSGMLVVASGSDLWWSGQTIGGEGTWFSAEQFFVTVEGEGDIVALAVQDGALYVFKERAIWTVAGEAPADNGSAGGLGTPRRLAGDVGCIEPTSVVVTSLGIFFRSHRGLELLGRGGSPIWIGEKVQRTLAAYPYVTSATLDMHNDLVRFSLASSIASGLVSGDGRDIVFDPVINDWQSVDDKTGSVTHQASQDACTLTSGSDLRYAWLGADGTLYVENDTYLDGSTWITMVAETGWFKVAGIQGRQFFNRLLMLARKRTDADLSVSLGYNYGTAYAAQSTWTSANVSNLLTAGWPITQLRHDPSNDSEGQSVRVRVQDASPTGAGAVVGTGRGATWLALTLDITPQDGTFEVPEEAA